MESRKNKVVWYAVILLFIVLFGAVLGYFFSNENGSSDLGTYNNPEVALRETQKTVLLLSQQINFGIENVLYIQEYENSKNLIFKQ